jgi:hypothetical protein
MGFIPDDARWYLADVILEYRVAGDPRNVVHVNTHLVEAGSPEEAYAKAIALGRSSEQSYHNTDGRRVEVIFRGLRALGVIHDPLEDGAELTYTEDIGVTEGQLRAWARPKAELSVFAPREAPTDRPNFLPGEFRWLLLGPDRGEGNDPRTDLNEG